jgi:hypothetical protein
MRVISVEPMQKKKKKDYCLNLKTFTIVTLFIQTTFWYFKSIQTIKPGIIVALVQDTFLELPVQEVISDKSSCI